MPTHTWPRARLAVIEDDPVFTELVCDLLGAEGYDVAVCATWQDAHAFVRRRQPDLVLLDLRLGGDEHGWRVLDHLTLDPTTRPIPVILWSGAHESLKARARALHPEHGVFVLPKPFDLVTLVGTITQALASNSPVVTLNSRRPAAKAPRRPLTEREEQVAMLIARGLTNQEIATELVLTLGTVANHVAHILHKLDVKSRVQIAIWVMATGLIEPRSAEGAQPVSLADLPFRRSARSGSAEDAV